MSRTFRLRSLPTLKAQKFTNSRLASLSRNRRQHISNLVAAEYPEAERFGSYWFYFHPSRGLEDKLEAEVISPILPMFCHPWASGHAGVRIKTWYKRNGHKWLRRRAKKMMKMEQYDNLPSKMVEAYDCWLYL